MTFITFNDTDNDENIVPLDTFSLHCNETEDWFIVRTKDDRYAVTREEYKRLKSIIDQFNVVPLALREMK